MSDALPDLSDFPDTLSALVRDGTLRRYRKRAIVISEGDIGGSLFVLVEGTVRIFSQDENGRELNFGLLDAGTIFGEMSLEGGTRIASVEAISDCLCAEVPYAVLKQRLAENTEFAFYLISTLIGRSRSATESSKNLALKTVYQRVVELLEKESVLEDGVRQLPRKMSQQELANRVGASRDMISKIFKDLTTGHYIDASNGQVVILKNLPRRW